VSTDLVGPITTFHGGPHRYSPLTTARPFVIYAPPRDTMDPRWAACLDHHVACDCREAEWAERLADMTNELRYQSDAAWRALQGHQVAYPRDEYPGTWPLCLCSGCVIHRECWLLPPNAIDHRTGRVRPAPDGGAGEEVPF
jgi:hypothetical protein